MDGGVCRIGVDLDDILQVPSYFMEGVGGFRIGGN